MRLFSAAAVAILLSSGMAFAQDTTTTGSTDAQNEASGGTDASNYLSGPNIHRFYQDESMAELRSEAEIRSTWDEMNEQDQTSLRQACMGNKDNRFNPLCTSIEAM